MLRRTVQPEILDSLDHDDPEAIRARRDLVLINALMRGQEWIIKELKKQSSLKRVVELGAGSGTLVSRVQRELPLVEVVGMDLAPRPQGLDEGIGWVQGDVMTAEMPCDRDTVVVANLFLHHFNNDRLVMLAERLQGAGGFLFAEPLRAVFYRRASKLLFPLINRVTRHDMLVSIEAGFVRGELPACFSGDVEWLESRGFLGSLRSKGKIS